jgi:hypothetical protein
MPFTITTVAIAGFSRGKMIFRIAFPPGLKAGIPCEEQGTAVAGLGVAAEPQLARSG